MNVLRKYSTFFIFLWLVALWAAFFSSVKYIVWLDLAETLKPDLQVITGYLSFGWIFAYLIGGAFAVTFLKKYYLFVISLLSVAFIWFSYLVWFESSFMLAFVISFLWFLYGLWTVVKNVILAIEIKKTWLSDTVVNAIAEIIFVVFIIWGTILGNVIFEQIGRSGYVVIIGMLVLSGLLSFGLNYDKITFRQLIKNGWKNYFGERKKSLTKALKLYFPDLKYVCKNYGTVMIVSWLLWAISTVASQISMEHSMWAFSLEASSASYLFLYSAAWAILWNIISMKMWERRWYFWLIFSSLFSILIIIFPFLSFSFSYMSGLAFFLWLFFGASSNLIDSFFIKKIGDEDKKEYGSSVYGFVLSIVIFLVMFLSNWIEEQFGYTIIMILLWISMFISSVILYIKQKN